MWEDCAGGSPTEPVPAEERMEDRMKIVIVGAGKVGVALTRHLAVENLSLIHISEPTRPY